MAQMNVLDAAKLAIDVDLPHLARLLIKREVDDSKQVSYFSIGRRRIMVPTLKSTEFFVDTSLGFERMISTLNNCVLHTPLS